MIICTMLNGRTFSVILIVTVVFYAFRIGDGNQKTQGNLFSFLSYPNIFVFNFINEIVAKREWHKLI